MKRQRNIEAFTDKRGVVHPIRRSSGYDDEKTGSTDFDFRDWAAEEREQRKAEERELERDYARYHPEAGKSLATFVRQRGGFRYDGIHDGEIDRLRKAESGTSGLVSLDKGKGLTFKRGRGLKPDRMLETAIEAGVVSPDTSLAQFMDDVEMSATKRNPKVKRFAPIKRGATCEGCGKAARIQYLGGNYCLACLPKKKVNPFPTATVEKAWQAWRKAEKAKSPKAQALETKFVKVYMASQKRKRNPIISNRDKAALLLDKTHAIGERGPATMIARNKLATWLDLGGKFPSSAAQHLLSVVSKTTGQTAAQILHSKKNPRRKRAIRLTVAAKKAMARGASASGPEVQRALRAAQKVFKRGDRVTSSGYPGKVTKVHGGQLRGMVDVRLPGGQVTLDIHDVKKVASDAAWAKLNQKLQPKKRNFTVKAAGRLKVGNPGLARLDRLYKASFKATNKWSKSPTDANFKAMRAAQARAMAAGSKQTGKDRERSKATQGKGYHEGLGYKRIQGDLRFRKQNPPATLKLEGVNYNVVTWETAADMDAKGHKNVARMMRENKAIAQVGMLRPAGKTLYHVVLFENGGHSKIMSLGRVKNPLQCNPVSRKRITQKLAHWAKKKSAIGIIEGDGRVLVPAETVKRLLTPEFKQSIRRDAFGKTRRLRKRKNISIKVGGKTRFKASKKGVSIGGRVQLKANPGRAKKNGSISERRQDRLWRSAQKAQKAGKTALADQRLTRSAALARKVQDKWYSQSRVDDRQKRYKEYPRAKNPVRIVFNRLLGGWYIVHGPHQTPISGRFSSREEAKAHMAAQQAARDQRGLPKHRRNGIFETFTGRKATKQTALNAPDGTPKRLDKLGKLIGLYAENGTIKPRVPVWLCSDSKGKLHLATSAARLIDGGPQSFGEVKKIEYETTKKHLDGKPTIYFHHFGEEGGKRPTLHADGKGGLKLRGGSYKIRAEGIRD